MIFLFVVCVCVCVQKEHTFKRVPCVSDGISAESSAASSLRAVSFSVVSSCILLVFLYTTLFVTSRSRNCLFSQSAEDLHSSCDSLSSLDVAGISHVKSDVYSLSATITNTGENSVSFVQRVPAFKQFRTNLFEN